MSNIYLGLQSYKESNSQYFKGRQEDAQTLFEQVIHNEYTVCYALHRGQRDLHNVPPGYETVLYHKYQE